MRGPPLHVDDRSQSLDQAEPTAIRVEVTYIERTLISECKVRPRTTMTALPPATIMDEHRLDEKPEIDQSEDVSRPALYAPEYLNWSLLQTTQQFWRSIMFACMVALGATFDGYAVTGTLVIATVHVLTCS